MEEISYNCHYYYFIDPIYTAGKAAVQQVIDWTNNDEIETMLLSTKEKIVDVTARLSDNASIETALPIEDIHEAEVALQLHPFRNLKQS